MSNTRPTPAERVTEITNYWSFDPGLTTGWAHFNAKGEVQLFSEVYGLDKLSDFLEAINVTPTIIVMEDYIINPNIPQGGTKVVASEAIGRICHYARIRGIDIIRQPNTIKPDAYRLAKIIPPKRKKDEHKFDAYVHGYWYLVKIGVIDNRSKLLKELKRNV